MDQLLERVSMLSVPAAEGKEDALKELREIAETTYIENASVAASAYRAIVLAQQARLYELKQQIDDYWQSRREYQELSNAYGSYLVAHREAIKLNPRLYEIAPSFSVYLLQLRQHGLQTPAWQFSNYIDRDITFDWVDGELVNSLHIAEMISYRWVCSHFVSLPTDKESVTVLAATDKWGGLIRFADPLQEAKFWRLVEVAVAA